MSEAFATDKVARIAERVGLSYQSVKKWKAGDLPSIETLIKIASLTNSSIHWLLTGEGEKTLNVRQQLKDFGNKPPTLRQQINSLAPRPIAEALSEETDCEDALLDLMPREMERLIRQQAAALNVTIAEQVVQLAKECLEQRQQITDTGRRTLPMLQMTMTPEEQAIYERSRTRLELVLQEELLRQRESKP